MKRSVVPPDKHSVGSIRPIALFQQIDAIADYFTANANRINPGVLSDAKKKLHNAADRIDRAKQLTYWEDYTDGGAA